ncbi:hypothetical protein X777_16917 [Ooceraea biroi]|uniref:Uncharacterized protein n=1 Tax=Ooceraea biroi TaxID=2015173 RepID=A0A026WSJ8_OOCBI|nr:hypothetical protein X777_16917 [Ooceraea biroi]
MSKTEGSHRQGETRQGGGSGEKRSQTERKREEDGKEEDAWCGQDRRANGGHRTEMASGSAFQYSTLATLGHPTSSKRRADRAAAALREKGPLTPRCTGDTGEEKPRASKLDCARRLDIVHCPLNICERYPRCEETRNESVNKSKHRHACIRK